MWLPKAMEQANENRCSIIRTRAHIKILHLVFLKTSLKRYEEELIL